MGVKLMYVFALPNILKQLFTKIIGCIRNVRIGSFFNVYLCNTLFEILFVTLNQKLDLSFFKSFIYYKN